MEHRFILGVSATNSDLGVVFLDPVRHIRTDIMKRAGHAFLMDKVRFSRNFVAASEDASALRDSDRMDLAEVDSKTRFFQALKRNWGKGDEPWNAYFGTSLDFVNEAVADMISDDVSNVTHRISWALDGIEPHLSNDMLRWSAKQWREELGRWRNVLAKLDKELGECPVPSFPGLLRARERVDKTSRRVETTFNALVGSNTMRLLAQKNRKDESNSGACKKVAVSGTWQGTVGNV